MAIFDIGPDGMILLEALIVSALIALLAWRRVPLTRAAALTGVVAFVLVSIHAWYQARHPDQEAPLTAVGHVAVAMFTIVPSALLLGVSRLQWIARRSWALLVVGPILFVGCFVGICELCARARLI